MASNLFAFTEEDEIIVPSISFIAIGNSIVSKGAKVVFCDVDRRSLNMTAENIAKKITPKTKAIFINHYGGVPCDMSPILQICKEANIIVIEDSACAPKSFYKGKACGTFGDMGMWSFDAMKILCTGDGGMLYLKSKDLIEIAKEQLYLGTPVKQRSGLDSSASRESNWWEFDINRPGRRAIMNNIAGAIGVEQLKKLDSFIFRRKEIYETYERELSHCERLRMPPLLNEEYVSSYYFFWIQLEKRDQLARFLLDHGVYSTFRYWPLHKIKYFTQEQADLPNSEYVCNHTLNIPLHQSLSDADVFKIIELIVKFSAKHL